MARLLAILGLVLLALAAGSGRGEGAKQERIIAVGDLHGDFEAWRQIARAAKLTDEKGTWTGGTTWLVQMGDVTDRGPDSLKIIRHLQRLQGEARIVGGDVIILMGNHEAMNVIGDLRYVHPGEYDAFADKQSKRRRHLTWRANREEIAQSYFAANPKMTIKAVRNAWYDETPLGKLEHRRAWQPGGELGLWAASLPAVARIGDTLFVHGGLSVERGREPIASINARHKAALEQGEAIDRSMLDDPLGPLWYRGNVRRGEVVEGTARPGREEELEQVLAFHGARRLVVGHTPSRSGIADEFGGRLLRVDSGISAHYGGPASYLEIQGSVIRAHERGRDGAWISRIIASETGDGS